MFIAIGLGRLFLGASFRHIYAIYYGDSTYQIVGWFRGEGFRKETRSYDAYY